MDDSPLSAQAWLLDTLEPIPAATHTESIHTPSWLSDVDRACAAYDLENQLTPDFSASSQFLAGVDATPSASVEGVDGRHNSETEGTTPTGSVDGVDGGHSHISESEGATPILSEDGVDSASVDPASIPCPMRGNHVKWDEGPDPPICPLCAEMRRCNLMFLANYCPGILSLI